MGRTTKPCPGCKTVNSSRAADEVCYKCKRLMEDGQRYRQIATDDSRENRSVVSARHHWPYIHCCGDRYRYEFQQHFLDLALLLSRDVGQWEACEPLVFGQDGGRIRSFPTGVADVLESLYKTTQMLSKVAYAEGRKDGHSFIVNLAAGGVSLEDFDKAK